MSFCKTNYLIQEGDVAIVYLSYNSLYPIKVKRGQSHSSKYGSLKHSDIIGKPYGSKFECTKGSVYVLQGSPELWTISLPHRTQIIYTPNISMITLNLQLKPGSLVIESGTGSGSLSHAIIRTIYPTGHLHTFDFHEKRCETARQEFEEHKMSEYVTVRHRDVCNNGFGLENVADAVFLDLPNPWKAIKFAKEALKRSGGRICSFSPCIEQVQKTADELVRLGFTEIQTLESLRRVLSVKNYIVPEFDFNINNENQSIKQRKLENDSKNQEKNEDADEENGLNDDNEQDDEDDDPNCSTKRRHVASKPINLQPGHTGFLTFATLLDCNDC